MSATGIHHVAFTVRDWSRSEKFYKRLAAALGVKPLIEMQGAPHRDADGHVLIFAGDGFMFSIWEAARELRGKAFQIYSVGLHHAAFKAPSRAAVDVLHEELVAMGAAVLDPPHEYGYAPGYYAVFFTDPDGVKLEYAHVPS
jgi:glyoxylase I family protein